jgi:hypothetical protein
VTDPGLHLVIDCRSGESTRVGSAEHIEPAVAELTERADELFAAQEAAQIAAYAALGEQRDALAELEQLAKDGRPVDAALLLRVLGPRLAG